MCNNDDFVTIFSLINFLKGDDKVPIVTARSSVGNVTDSINELTPGSIFVNQKFFFREKLFYKYG